MTHVEEHVNETASRAGYHNRIWAERMKVIGLYPSNTGKPGGKELGQQMQHFIAEGGPFVQSFARLEASGWRLNIEGIAEPEPEPRPEGDDADAPEAEPEPEPEADSSKTKFSCPGCNRENVWGKPSTHVLCGRCGVRLEPCG
jgi:ribosomal protein S27E